jgi:DNA repair protein RecN (Recombination protein N)
MLASLEIKNYLLIKKLKIEFSKGFNTFTGETGAGKSIIIEGLKLALGGRNFKELKIQKNQKIVLCVIFNINKEILEKLEKLNITLEDDYLIIQREINDEMKSKIFINNELATQNLVRNVSEIFIEIQDNYEQQELFNNSYFINYIDKLSNLDKKKLTLNYEIFIESKKAFDTYNNKKEEVDKELNYLNISLDKLKQLNPQNNEYDDLNNKKKLLKNQKQVIQINNDLINLLDNYEEVTNVLTDISKNLNKLALINDSYLNIDKNFNDSFSILSENLNEIRNDISFDEEEMLTIEEIDNRIFSYNSIAKINNIEPEKIHELFDSLKVEIEELTNYEKNLEILRKKYEKDKNDFIKEATIISLERKRQGLIISKAINQELPKVNIEQGEIKFDFTYKEENQYSIDGIDNIDVGFKTIKNTDFSSIKKVASGGELSRLLLIMKSFISKNDTNKTIIFDEVDSGLSGKVSGVVADKIVDISKFNQVLAITHSPQVAAKADKHWKIVKNIKNSDIMESSIIELNQEDRIEEIANIFSGSSVSKASREVAKDLLLKK